MRNPRETRDKLLKIAEPVCTGAGYELVDLRFVNEGNWVVRVFIDYPVADPSEDTPGHSQETGRAEKISFRDCVSVSRELSAVFDVEDPVPQAYRLEVSSPGVDRPIRTTEHFERFVGERAKVSLSHGLDGRRKFTGVIRGVDRTEDGTFIDLEVDGQRFRLPFDHVASARLIPDWDRLIADHRDSHESH